MFFFDSGFLHNLRSNSFLWKWWHNLFQFLCPLISKELCRYLSNEKCFHFTPHLLAWKGVCFQNGTSFYVAKVRRRNSKLRNIIQWSKSFDRRLIMNGKPLTLWYHVHRLNTFCCCIAERQSIADELKWPTTTFKKTVSIRSNGLFIFFFFGWFEKSFHLRQMWRDKFKGIFTPKLGIYVRTLTFFTALNAYLELRNRA